MSATSTPMTGPPMGDDLGRDQCSEDDRSEDPGAALAAEHEQCDEQAKDQLRQHAFGLLAEDQEGEVPQIRLADRIGNALEHEDATEGAGGRCSYHAIQRGSPKSNAATARSSIPAPIPKWMIGSAPPPVASATPIATGTVMRTMMAATRPRIDRTTFHLLLERRNVNGLGTLRLTQRWPSDGL